MAGNRFAPIGLAVLLWLAATAAFSQQLPQDGIPKQDRASDPAWMDLESLLNTKVTTVAKFAEQISDAGGVISVVSRDELRRFGGITLSEILERLAGLTRSTAFMDRSLVAVRGDQTRANEGHVLILIDGRPAREIMEGGLSSDLLESFPVRASR